MTFAYDYPLLGLFWTFAWFYIVMAALFLLFHVILEVFRSERSGVAKAGWLALILFLPFIGVLAYLATSGSEIGSFHERRPGMADDYRGRGI